MGGAAARTALRAACAAASLCLILAAAGAQGAEAKPRRIVSLNLCTDQLAMLLADRDRIKSVSFLAADPASSAMAEEAKGLRLNHGRAEEVLPLAPDLVLTGVAAARPATELLSRLGHRVVELPLAQSLDDVPRHIRLVARAVGEESRGEALIARFAARLKALPFPPPGPRPVAVLFGPHGITAGGNALPGAVLRRAGFDNLADREGIGGVGRVALETVVARRPDALILGRLDREYPSLAVATLRHPALEAAMNGGAVMGLPHSLWACATPVVAEAVARLAHLRARINKARAP